MLLDPPKRLLYSSLTLWDPRGIINVGISKESSSSGLDKD